MNQPHREGHANARANHLRNGVSVKIARAIREALERQFERAHRHNFGLTSFFDARISERPHIGRNFVFEENLNLLNARLVNPHARAETIHNLLV